MTAMNQPRKAKLSRAQKLGDSSATIERASFNPFKWLWFDFFEFEKVRINQDWVLLTIGITACITLFLNVAPVFTSLVRGSQIYEAIGEGNWMLIYATIAGITWAVRTHIPLTLTFLAIVGAVLSCLPLLAIVGINAGWVGYWLAQLLIMAALPIDTIVLLYTSVLIISLIPLGNPLFHLALLLRDWSRVLTSEPEAVAVKKTRTTKKEAVTENVSGAAQWMEQLLVARGFPAKVVGVIDSHRRTIFEISTPTDFKIKKISADLEDIERAASQKNITMETSVPNKPGISRIMIPKKNIPDPLNLADLMTTDGFKKSHPLALPMGQNIEGNAEYRRLDKMPHVLVSGTTGGGKSVTINCWITALLCKNSPKNLQLILIDPKMLEFSIYASSKHLAMPVILDMQKAQQAIQQANNEMEYRYAIMSAAKVRNMGEFNAKIKKKKFLNPLYADRETYTGDNAIISTVDQYCKPFPTLVLVIDEMADLILRFKAVEELIAMLAGKARAAGIHLIPCTQDPRKEVITGLIKANIAVRFALQVATLTESQTILGPGRTEAQHLLGNGDAYLLDGNNSVNVQSYFIEADEIEQKIEEQNAKAKNNQI